MPTAPPRCSRRRPLPAARLAALARLCAALLWAALLCAPTPARAADPELAAAGSLLLPGLGQVANGDYPEGALQASLYLVWLNQARQLAARPDYIPFDEREDPLDKTVRINRTTAIADQYSTAAFDLSLYSAFAAYRDARARPEYSGDYRTPAPRETLDELALAPFRPDYLLRPTTLAPLVIPLLLAVSPAIQDRLRYRIEDDTRSNELAARFFFMHGGVAIGEEAFFRGFVNTGLSDRFGENWGLAGSSVLFGLGHTGGGGQASAAGATLFGAYLGWIQQRNDYEIGQGVAIHFWWNFLTAITFLKADPQAHVTPIQITLRF